MADATDVVANGLITAGGPPVEARDRGPSSRRPTAAAPRRGTIEAGRIADLPVLDADPLADIHNIRKLSTAVKDGRVIELDRLPEHPVFYGREKDTRR